MLHLVLHDVHCFVAAVPCGTQATPRNRFLFSALPAHEQRRLNRYLLLESRSAAPASSG